MSFAWPSSLLYKGVTKRGVGGEGLVTRLHVGILIFILLLDHHSLYTYRLLLHQLKILPDRKVNKLHINWQSEPSHGQVMKIEIGDVYRYIWYVRLNPEVVARCSGVGCRVRSHDSCFAPFFPSPFFSPILLSLFPFLSFAFMLAPPLQCSRLFLEYH